MPGCKNRNGRHRMMMWYVLCDLSEKWGWAGAISTVHKRGRHDETIHLELKSKAG